MVVSRAMGRSRSPISHARWIDYVLPRNGFFVSIDRQAIKRPKIVNWVTIANKSIFIGKIRNKKRTIELNINHIRTFGTFVFVCIENRHTIVYHCCDCVVSLFESIFRQTGKSKKNEMHIWVDAQYTYGTSGTTHFSCKCQTHLPLGSSNRIELRTEHMTRLAFVPSWDIHEISDLVDKCRFPKFVVDHCAAADKVQLIWQLMH